MSLLSITSQLAGNIDHYGNNRSFFVCKLDKLTTLC
ncbi:hypothetical protein Alsa1_CDS0130 [Staphylococcus phage Alsa_1]|nr:hypothetical protein Alsa1_CDS0130 [Staphylococcus phage Alsa_1]